MFVINFDFSEEILPKKIFLINIPILLTQFITYPLQRLQTLLIDKPLSSYITKNQFQESHLILRQMIGIEGFPKIYHGLRYSLDYSMTLMTTKFIIFDLLMSVKQDIPQWMFFLNCLIANVTSTVFAQSAFNYQTIASSLPIDKNNRDQNVRIKLSEYTLKRKVPLIGLRYTVPVSIINSLLQIFMIKKASQIFKQNNQISYISQSLLTVFPIIICTNFFTHFTIQRQVQICNKHKHMEFDYKKGLLGSQLRQSSKNLILYCFYLTYFEYKTKSELEGLYQKKIFSSKPQSYRL